LIVATVDGVNKAMLEIEMKDGKIVRTGHDMRSRPDTRIEGLTLPRDAE